MIRKRRLVRWSLWEYCRGPSGCVKLWLDYHVRRSIKDLMGAIEVGMYIVDRDLNNARFWQCRCWVRIVVKGRALATFSAANRQGRLYIRDYLYRSDFEQQLTGSTWISCANTPLFMGSQKLGGFGDMSAIIPLMILIRYCLRQSERQNGTIPICGNAFGNTVKRPCIYQLDQGSAQRQELKALR